jgi:hypothetical protein
METTVGHVIDQTFAALYAQLARVTELQRETLKRQESIEDQLEELRNHVLAPLDEQHSRTA